MAASRRKRPGFDRDPLEERLPEELKDQVKTAQQDEAAQLVEAFLLLPPRTERSAHTLGQDGPLLPEQSKNQPDKPAATDEVVRKPPFDSRDIYQDFWLCLDRTSRRQVNVRLTPEVADILKAHTEFLQRVAGSPREIDNGIVLSLFLLTIDKCLEALASDWQDQVWAYKAQNPKKPDGAFWAMADLMAELIRRAGQNPPAGNGGKAEDDAAASEQ